MNGLVLLDKAPGRTSFQALFPIKKQYGKTVGHTGTLDSFAEGLLVVLVGKFTKFTPLFTAYDKVYEADFTFGRETSTLDPEGETVLEGPVPDNPGAIVQQFVGEQLQVPPNYSAIHVDGRRAYERVRDGEELSLPPRAVTIYSIDVLAWNAPVLTVRVHCSKGTYIRSLARDWGRALGTGAYVTRLRRTRVGPFELPSETRFLGASEALGVLGIPPIAVSAEAEPLLRNGRDAAQFVPELAGITAERVALVAAGRPFAVVENIDGRWKYLFVEAR